MLFAFLKLSDAGIEGTGGVQSPGEMDKSLEAPNVKSGGLCIQDGLVWRLLSCLDRLDASDLRGVELTAGESAM